jgi:uncharacterized protein (TIGR00369 family)
MTEVRNKKLVERIFRNANFLETVGIELIGYGGGWCEMQLRVSPAHHQQHGFVHAGALMTLADHACGGAAATTVPVGKDVITIENKVSFLRPGTGKLLKCRADVLKSGKNVIFVEAAITTVRENSTVMLVKASSTLSIIAAKEE